MKVKTDPLYYASVLLLAFVSFFFFDISIIEYAKQFKSTPVYDISKIVTKLGRAEYQIVPGALVWLIFRKRNPFVSKLGLAVGLSAAIAGLSADVLKFIAGRYRPSMYFSEGLYGFALFEHAYHKVSFPSGHTSTVFGAMGVLAIVLRRFRMLFLSVAMFVGLTRITTLHHYFSDVLVGSLFGMTASIFIVNKMKLYPDRKD